MKSQNILAIGSILLLLVVVWAFFTGKIKIGMKQDSSGSGSPMVQSQSNSSLKTGATTLVNNQNNVRIDPKPAPKGTVAQATNVSLLNSGTSANSNYSLKIRRPSSMQLN